MAKTTGGYTSYNQDWNLLNYVQWFMDPDPWADTFLIDKVWDANAAAATDSGVWPFKLQWHDTDLYNAMTTITEDLDNSETDITVASTDAILPGDIIKIGDECMKVTAKNPAVPSITVDTRPFSGSADTHTSGDTVWIMSSANPEVVSSFTTNSDYESAAPTAAYNKAQFSVIAMDKTQRMVFEEQTGNINASYSKTWLQTERIKTKLKMQNSLINGTRLDRSSASTPDAMGGIVHLHSLYGDAARNKASAGANLVWADITDAARILSNGGFADMVMIPKADFDIINRGWGDQVVMTRLDTTLGRTIKYLDTGFGILDIVRVQDGLLPSKTWYIGNFNDVKMGPVKGGGMNFDWALREAPSSGTVTQRRLECTYNAWLRNAKKNWCKVTYTTAVDPDGV